MRIYKQLKSEQDRRDKLDKEFRRKMAAIWGDQSAFGDINSGTGSGGKWHEVGPRRNSKAETSLPPSLQPYDLAGLEAGLLDELRLSQRTRAEIRRWDLAISPTNLKPPRYKYISLIQQKWCDIVKAYTECNLSYTSDKLVAIAGMAQMISRVTQCQYLAGLWRKDLEHHLLWKVESPSPAAVRDGTRGPSWSWASVDSGVEWEHWYGGFYAGYFSIRS
jgi:hypothetical protein